ncbi:stage II sporulation protein M [archaeon]|jgi:uncharacterized membrane protein SpoIIM required for sporulation|nr:stage II sporulation protein M [archaeon]
MVKKKKRVVSVDNFIYSNFKKAIDDLKLIRVYFWFSLIVFLGVTLFGAIFPVFFQEEVLELLRNIIGQTIGLGPLELTRFIMANNIQSSFFAMALGVFFGVIPLMIAVVNAYVLGFVINQAVVQEGPLIIWRLFPHGIFEIPAVLISISLGIYFGISFLSKIHKIYFSNISFELFFILGLLLFPITSIFIALFFLFHLYFNYIKYYLKKEKYLFLIISILISPIMMINIIFNDKLRNFWNEEYIDTHIIFIFVVVPLLVVAGVVEGLLIWSVG